MIAKRRSKAEQLDLILKCRKSGFSDSVWCSQNDINPGTFWNWVRRLRQSGYTIPDSNAADSSLVAPQSQEVVKLDLFPGITDAQENTCIPGSAPVPAMEISIGDATLRVSNEVNPELLRIALQQLGGISYAR